MDMDIYQDSLFRDLEKLNFTVNESKVYLSLLKLGPSLAGRISKESNLDRSSTYNALRLLLKKGIVSTIFESKRTTYIPSNPKKILDYIKEKEELANKIIPNLSKKFSVKKEKKNILVYQGYKGFKTIFQDVLDSVNKNEEYLVIGSEGQFSEKMPYFSQIFKKLKAEKKIKSKLLIREGVDKSTKGKYTNYKSIPSDVISSATINIYKDKVAIFIWEDNPEAVLIENEMVSKSFRNYFNFMWKNAKKI